MTLIHFRCSNCHSDFWLRTTPGTVCCPNPNCDNIWAPRTMTGAFELGQKENFTQTVHATL